MKKLVAIISTVAITFCLVISCDKTPGNPSAPSVTNAITNPAMSAPDNFAWGLFIELNQPSADNPKLSLWETWALAKCVFDNPDAAPTWPKITQKNIED